MKLKRLKGKGGKKWVKGSSCASNPADTKYREAAKSNFFQKLDGESGLTVEALAQHTAALAVEPTLHADPDDDKSIGKTFNTFATNFTTCTIPAFEKFFRNFAVDSELQTRMLAIHATAQEYIRDAKLTESSTSYMCALMASLEGVKDSEEDTAATLSLLAKVIRKVSPQVLKAKFSEYSKLLDELFTDYANSSNTKLLINVIGCLSLLLRAQDEIQWTYSSTLDLFHKIVSYTTHENAEIRRAATYNASAVLKGSSFMVQEEVDDEDDEEDMETEDKEAETSNARPEFRVHPASASVGKFIVTNLKFATENMNGKATLFLLIFLQQVIRSLSADVLEKCCARVLGVMHIGDTVVKKRALKVFGTLFSCETSGKIAPTLTKETNEFLINALTASNEAQSSLRLVPGMNDVELCTTWMDVVASGIIHLSKLDVSSAMDVFGRWIGQLTAFWKSDYDSVHEKVYHIVDFLFDECVKPLDDISDYVDPLLSAFHRIEKCLSLQFEAAWPFIFRSLCPFFWILSPYAPADMAVCLRNLSSMIDTADIKGKRQLESAVGSAINGMGPERVMEVIPLQITGDIRIDEKNFWILPLLRKYLKKGRLCFFESYFVHLASKCFIILDSLKKQGKFDSLLGKTYQQIECQIWSLFPVFAKGAEDIDEALSIQSFAKLICDHIKFRDDTRLDIMAGLRNMLNAENVPRKLSFFGKNYLPALFNLYIMKPRDMLNSDSKETTINAGQRQAAFGTIQAYLKAIPQAKVTEFFNLNMQKYEAEQTDIFKRKALLSLSRSFLPHLDSQSVGKIYQKIKDNIKTDFQKSAYKFLDDILNTNSPQCQTFIKENIVDILELLFLASHAVAPSSKAPRLRCLTKMLDHCPSEIPHDQCVFALKKVVEEAVSCCGRNNSIATRKAAFLVLTEVGKSVQTLMQLSTDDTFLYCLDLLPPLLPPSESTANTILALMGLLYHYQDLMPGQTLQMSVEEISSLLANEDRSILKSCLSFIRMVFVLYPVPVMSDYVDRVVKRIVAMPKDARKSFRKKIRDILASLSRKFGAERIKDLIPENDYMRKMLTNVVKRNRRRKRTKKDDESESDDDDYVEAPTTLDEILGEIDRDIEEDDEKVSTDKRVKLKAKTKFRRQKQTWIKEDEDDIVDLLDPTSSQNITNKRPREKKLRFEDEKPQMTDEQKYGFKRDKSTNKFIITEQREDRDDDDNDSDENEESDVFKDITVQGDRKFKLQRAPKRKRNLSENSDDSTQTTQTRKSGNSVSGDRRLKARRKFDYGSEFRAKKAGGDVAKKGGVAPYAYVQFSKDKLNKRKKSKYAGQFKSLVKGAKRGAVKGTKMRRKR